VALINGHPTRRMRCTLALNDAPKMKSVRCRQLTGRRPLSPAPNLRTIAPPRLRGQEMNTTLPPASLTVIELEKE